MRWRRERRQKRGRCAGLQAGPRIALHRPSFTSIFLANVRSLTNKMEEVRLWFNTQRTLRDRWWLILMEMWLSHLVPDGAVELASWSLYRADRTKGSGKRRGGKLCIYINNDWCPDVGRGGCA